MRIGLRVDTRPLSEISSGSVTNNKKVDPLLVVASAFSGLNDLKKQNKIKTVPSVRHSECQTCELSLDSEPST